MNPLYVFGIGAGKILQKNCCTQATITGVQKSCLYVVKKPVRLYINDQNTLFSHYITFRYTVDAICYTGKLFVSPRFRCPQKGEQITVCYDPDDPQKYACYPFPPAVRPIGW